MEQQTRLEAIRKTLCPCPACLDSDKKYLLKIIDLQARQIEAATLAVHDPDNENDDTNCYCATLIQDDQGTTIVSEYNPLCPTHGTQTDPVL